MRIDFYQLGSAPLAGVVASIARKLLAEGSRLLVVADDPDLLAALDKQLWDQGPTSFLPHALAGTGDDDRQPLLLSTTVEPANRALNLLIADGRWRDAAAGFERCFFLFDEQTLQPARAAWKSLAAHGSADRRYWALEEGRWVEKARLAPGAERG